MPASCAVMNGKQDFQGYQWTGKTKELIAEIQNKSRTHSCYSTSSLDSLPPAAMHYGQNPRAS